MRTVWRGTIGVGSSAIPVKAYSATEEPGSGQLQLHLTDGGWLRPEVPATKPCVLLAEALLTAGRVALVKVAIRLVPPTAAIQDESLTELLRALQSSAQDRTHADQRVANAKAAANKAAEAKGRARKATSKAKSAPRTRR
ncbi:hypothetical protein [Amycolatopsis methanolica]|uniref:hypothetical protein n=1 Tax=Amycolatopsis methanolica TaxID=1814 RepID=UPI0034273D90